MMTENQPDNVGGCFSFLCKQLWVMHHLLQEANYSHFQLCVQLKVLRIHKRTTTVLLERCCCCVGDFSLFFCPARAEKDRQKEEKGERENRDR